MMLQQQMGTSLLSLDTDMYTPNGKHLTGTLRGLLPPPSVSGQRDRRV